MLPQLQQQTPARGLSLTRMAAAAGITAMHARPDGDEFYLHLQTWSIGSGQSR